MTKTIIAQLKKNKKTFDLLLDFDKYLEWKNNKKIPIEDLIVGEYCFSDIKKAERANEEDLKECFGSIDLEKIAEEILKKGQIQMTTKEKQELQERKRKQIIDFICREGLDPRTNCPPTPARIELAFKEAHFNVEVFGNIDEQIKEALKKIMPVLPIIIQKDEIELKIPISDSRAVQRVVRESAKILKEKWTSDFWIVFVEISSGKSTSFLEHLTKMCKNEIIVNKK
ncbi:MAG: ribosome assembly factor SBDS [Candidatus Aenigmarchaeota archaeon]|nr:ribosome assembly factor SBDS [Candidatus Aenigmarchaeota archaeon]